MRQIVFVDPCHMDTFSNGLEQILNMKTSPSIANKGDHSMPTLQNPRHERFAQELATGQTADAAYVLAGYPPSASRDIQNELLKFSLWVRTSQQSHRDPNSRS